MRQTILKISNLGAGVQLMDLFLLIYIKFLYSHLQFRGQTSEYCLLGMGRELRILR